MGKILRRVWAFFLVLSSGIGWTADSNPAVSPRLSQISSGQSGQQKGKERPQEGLNINVNVQLVAVDVVVRNKQGTFIGDLQPGEFHVYDNGVAQRITHFSRDQLPLAVALVIDRSSSLTPYVRELRNAALAALRHLKPEDQVALFTFSENPEHLSDLTDDQSEIGRHLEELKTGGLTNIFDAIYDAAEYLRGARDRRRAVILISDFFPTSLGTYTGQDALQMALEADVVVYGIKTHGDNSEPATHERGFAEKIVSDTGGELFHVGDAGSLARALESAIWNLRTQYTLGFTPSDPGKEGGFHRLKITPVAGRCPDCRVKAASGYYAGKRADLQPVPSAGIYHPVQTLIDASPSAVTVRYPRLEKTLRSEEDQEELASLLEKVGRNVENFLKYFPNTASSEQVRQERGSLHTSSRYQYLILVDPSNITEYRTDSKGKPAGLGGLEQGFALTSGFAVLSLILHPSFQPESRFRYLGTTTDPVAHLIAFAQIPGTARISHVHWQSPILNKVRLYYQGLVWVDPRSCQIIRMYAELLAPRQEVGLEWASLEIEFEQVSFKNGSAFWLPHVVNVFIRQREVNYRNQHRYSDYKLFTVESHVKLKPPQGS